VDGNQGTGRVIPGMTCQAGFQLVHHPQVVKLISDMAKLTSGKSPETEDSLCSS
jgi:hypothetical protein